MPIPAGVEWEPSRTGSQPSVQRPRSWQGRVDDHPDPPGGEQAANSSNEKAGADTQRRQTPRSETLSKHYRWSRDGDACIHTARGRRGAIGAH
jgi:hypothetical protein